MVPRVSILATADQAYLRSNTRPSMQRAPTGLRVVRQTARRSEGGGRLAGLFGRMSALALISSAPPSAPDVADTPGKRLKLTLSGH